MHERGIQYKNKNSEKNEFEFLERKSSIIQTKIQLKALIKECNNWKINYNDLKMKMEVLN
jgi:hypothetical protein